LELEEEIAKQEFWKDEERSRVVLKELKVLKSCVEPFARLESEFTGLEEIVGIAGPEDVASLEHFKKDIAALKIKADEIEFRTLLGGEADSSNAILSINAGAGGTESCDWAAMLLRMYSRWAEDRGFGVTSIDTTVGEEAGVKNATIIIKGDWAYGHLKSETGVHRLVRISPFDSNKRRHTSFASVDVIPEVSDDIQIEVKEADLRIDTYRAGGAGGQHVNKTDSAVRITHMPTGIVVQCQNERSQLKNRSTAMKILKARLYDVQRAKKAKDLETAYEAKKDIAFGSQIRSYVLHPYSMVKDHRTGFETGKSQAVLNGEIGPLMEAYLKWSKGQESKG